MFNTATANEYTPSLSNKYTTENPAILNIQPNSSIFTNSVILSERSLAFVSPAEVTSEVKANEAVHWMSRWTCHGYSKMPLK